MADSLHPRPEDAVGLPRERRVRENGNERSAVQLSMTRSDAPQRLVKLRHILIISVDKTRKVSAWSDAGNFSMVAVERKARRIVGTCDVSSAESKRPGRNQPVLFPERRMPICLGLFTRSTVESHLGNSKVRLPSQVEIDATTQHSAGPIRRYE